MNCLSISLFLIFSFYVIIAQKSKNDFLHKISDVKEFKKFIRTHTNVLVIFAPTEKDFKSQELFKTVSEKVKGTASIVLADCSIDKKFCKKLKSSPSSIEYKHYKDGDFHKVYDRKFTVKSMVKFLLNPSGETPWDEDETAVDVVHLETRADMTKLLSKEKKPVLIMFYAPWCGFCKKLKPDFAEAASILKGEAVLAGMDVDTIEGSPVRMEFNITGFPTLIYFKNGEKVMDYGGANDKDGIISWMRNPTEVKPTEPEEEWSDIESDVIHLSDVTFDDFVNKASSVLVMFYAPWCGHCKKMKPEYQDAAAWLKRDKIDGALSAVDATKHQKLAERFAIKGFPTVKYFKNGEEQFDMNERTASAIVSFMKNPKEPPPPPPADQPWEDIPSYVEHLNDNNFKSFIKRKKHCLVIFYAPWCGHCKKAKPEFMQAAEELKDDNKISFAAVDCTRHNAICQTHDVTGYPTFKYFNYGKNDQKYFGGREKKDFISFMRNPSSTHAPPPATPSSQSHWSDIPGYDVISILDASNFKLHIQKYEFVVVTFYAAGCKHCVEMRKDFVDAAQSFAKDKASVSFAAVDAMNEVGLREMYFIQELPTIKVFKNGKELMEFDDSRTKNNFINLVKNPPKEVVPFDKFKSDVVHIISASSFDQELSNNKHLFIFFHDPSNNKCFQAQSAFWEAAENFDTTRNNVLFAVCDCVQHQSLCRSQSINRVPTFNLYTDGKLQESYDSSFITSFSYQHFITFLIQALAKITKTEL